MSARQVRARQAVDVEIAVVAEDDRAAARSVITTPWLRWFSAEQMKALRRSCERLTPAQRRMHPERDRAEEGARRRCRRSGFPRSCWDRASRHSSEARSCPSSAGARTAATGDQAHDGLRRNRILAACLPILASHQSPADFSAGVSGFTGLDRVNAVPLQPKNVTQNTAIALT